MEINKEQAEKCRDLGASALRQGDITKAVRMLEKSLKLHALPGVEALLSQAKSKLHQNENNNATNSESTTGNDRNNTGSSSTHTNGTHHSNNSRPRPQSQSTTSSTTPPVAQRQQSGLDGRAYTDEQVLTIKKIVQAKASGRGAHYRVLGLENGESSTENDIKKAYRKISLKVHPDKNSAPGADEAFKAVGLAYATLSDKQKRQIYDRYGDEDPDHIGGGSGMNPANAFRRRGGGGTGEVSPEDIFNAFFGGGMGGGGMGGNGFHVYSTGFGPGMHFQTGGPRRQRQQQPRRAGEPAQPVNQQANLGALLQFLPLLLIILVSFFRQDDDASKSTTSYASMPGENKYFSLTNKTPFTNKLNTKLTSVKDIPYFVSDSFLRTFYRDRYQLSQVERMVESAYENYLYKECQIQSKYKLTLQQKATALAQQQEKTKTTTSNSITDEERNRAERLANEFVLTRCLELDEFFPNRRKKQKQKK